MRSWHEASWKWASTAGQAMTCPEEHRAKCCWEPAVTFAGSASRHPIWAKAILPAAMLPRRSRMGTCVQSLLSATNRIVGSTPKRMLTTSLGAAPAHRGWRACSETGFAFPGRGERDPPPPPPTSFKASARSLPTVAPVWETPCAPLPADRPGATAHPRSQDTVIAAPVLS